MVPQNNEREHTVCFSKREVFFAMQLLLPMKFAMIWQVNYQHDWLVSESYYWYICSVTFYRVVTLAVQRYASALFLCFFTDKQSRFLVFFLFFVFVLEKWGITSWPCCWMKNTRMMSKHHHLHLNWLPWKIIESFSCHCTSL